MLSKNNTDKRSKIVFLPYAGASVYNYAKWKSHLSINFEAVFLEYPGRGAREEENYLRSIKEIVEDLYGKLLAEVDGNDYYIFAHSLGGLVAYELSLKIQHEQKQMPKILFISGRVPPEFCEKANIVSHLPDLEFLQVVSQYDGIPVEFYEDEDTRNAFLPTLRADFKLLENYKEDYHTEKLNCHVMILYSKNDTSIIEKEMLQWKMYSNKDLYFTKMSGNHFYCMEESNYIKIIKRIEMMAEIYG